MASPTLGEGRITRARYWQLVAEGVIGPDDRVELLEGVIVAMSPQSPPHAFVIGQLTRWLSAAIGEDAFVRLQMPLDVSDVSTPEPDLAVVAGRVGDFAAVHPTTALLVVEVADSSLVQDRLTKGPMYAAAGIAEYWLVNPRERGVEVYRRPIVGERRYAEAHTLVDGELVMGALPGSSIHVADLLPPV